jgi:hypothetical protein
MKQLQKLKLLTLILVGLLIYSCQNEEGYSLEKQETAIDIANLVYFKGIPVNHRFKTSIVNFRERCIR